MEQKSVKFSEYNPQADNWDNYIDRLKYCFEANGVFHDTAKRANFFTICGAQVFETFLALITPRKSSEVTFSEIESILTKHYSPKPNEISMSYKFYKCDQKPNQTAAEYIAQLRKLSSGCNFADLERMLRDRLVCGMTDHKLQCEFLQKDKLNYTYVVETMLSTESAVRDVRMILGCENSVPGSSNIINTSPGISPPEPMEVNALQSKSNTRFCYRCGERHGGECRFINVICHFCKKRGHIEKVCMTKKKNKSKNINYTDNGSDFLLNGIYNVGDTKKRIPAYMVNILLEGQSVVMQIDCGAGFSLLNEHTWRSLRAAGSHALLHSAHDDLHTWTLSPVHLMGQARVQVQFKNIVCYLDVLVAKGCGPNLIGRDWFSPLNITINVNCLVDVDTSITNKIMIRYQEVFMDGLGTYRGDPVAIHLKPDATPKFLKARPVPFAIKKRVESEIDRLVKEDVLRPLSYSEWATPVVPIVKKTGEIRLCGDYRSTVNQATESDTYPMPTASEVFAIISGGQFFTTLDLDRAYTQVTVDDATAKMLTLNTCKGLYSVHRLAFGVKACPGIFQRLMTALLAGIPGVAILIDDIIISGKSLPEMNHNLEAVLKRIHCAGLRLNKAKCKFARPQVEFLGFIIDSNGIHPAPSKVESIRQTPAPQNIKELQAFLGLYNFYERFIPHKATILEPLHRLLDKSATWQWTAREQNSFETAKHLLSSDLTLVHYELDKPLILTCDSSEYGVGAVLSHIMDDGKERPIALSSRTLHSHERHYSQLDKEATAIMFGIQKFHNYLMGRTFTIITDHKPLLGIFNPKKPMPNMLSPRLTRIAIALTSHCYNIEYRPGVQIGNADSLSRWPQPVQEQPKTQLYNILLMAETPQDFPFQADQIESATRADKIMSRVAHYILNGWPTKVTEKEVHPYWLQRSELSLQEGCILFGCRVVVPPPQRIAVLKALHKTHNGMVNTKALARSYVWWPQLNKDIETLVGGCAKCLENRHMPPKSTHEWITPRKPWSRINIDFAGPYQKKNFLIVVDAYSRWPEVFIINNTSTETVIWHLRNLFATHGLCETLVSDNGTPFVSQQMKTFLDSNKIKHITTAPYHPATNGLAERMVQTIKDKLSKMEDLSWDVRIPNMLLGLRMTPCAGTHKSPAELLMNRRLRTLLDTIHPDNIQQRKTETQVHANAVKRHREAAVNQSIMYRNYGQGGPRWLPGKVVRKEGPSSYIVETGNGAFVNRHIDQLVKRKERENIGDEEENSSVPNNPDVVESIQEEVSDNVDQLNEEIIEIPSSEKWAEMLGIPESSMINVSSGGGKHKTKIFNRSKPY